MDLLKLTEIAKNAALAAGELIQEYLDEDIKIEKKVAGTSYASQVVTKVDKACEKVILSYLQPTCQEYHLALLSEETEDDGSRFVADFFWCIDPMDGTLAFINKSPGFSVSIALLSKDGTPYIGIVFDPSTSTLYHAIKGQGAYKNNKPWKIERSNDHLTYVTDRKLKDTPQLDRIEGLLNEKVDQLGLSGIKEMSGAGSVLNGIRVLENGPALMLKLPKEEKGGGSIWDFAAIACIFQELGLTSTSYDGEKLDLNRIDSTFMNHKGIFFANLNPPKLS